MSQISFVETDLSWYYRQRRSSQITILVPGVSSWGPSNRPVRVNDSTFKKALGPGAVDVKDLSYLMAASYVKAGFDVLFWRIPLEGETVASRSFGGDNPAQIEGAKFRISARYPGSYGNNFAIKFHYVSDNVLYITVLDYTNGTVLEELTYDFQNPNSRFWWEEVDRTANYITIEFGEATKSTGLKFKSLAELDSSLKENTLYYLYNASVKEGNGVMGTNGTYDLDKIITQITGEVGGSILAELRDPLVYDFDIITNGGFFKKDGETISKIDGELHNLAKARGTAIFLVDGGKDMTATEFYNYCGTSRLENGIVIYEFDSSYAAAFGPWCSAQLLCNGSVRVLPGSYVMLVAWGQSMANGNPAWLAPAGVKRASLGGVVKETVYPVGSAIIDAWQAHEFVEDPTAFQYKVNPIARLKQYGYVVYGNSTLLRNRYDGATSQLQSFSTRVTANLIKRQAFDISLQLQFDQMDDGLFAEFKALMSTYLDQLLYGGALYDYDIIADRSEITLDDLNARTVPVRILISPEPAAENFVISLEISQAGVTFSGDVDASDTDENA